MFHSRTRNEFVVLPPAGLRIPSAFRNIEFDTQRHNRLLAAMQRLRGKTYLEDGAIRARDLTPDGRHFSTADERAWHVLSLDDAGNVVTCLRYLDERHSSNFNGLWVSHAALAHCPTMGWKLRKAVEDKMAHAHAARLGFGSVGGWAAAPEERRTFGPVSIILATFGLLELLGGCVGVATATFRHHSAGILRKIGLNPLRWSDADLPPYFDPQYGCEMEILEFDSRRPNPKYREAIASFMTLLKTADVVAVEPVVPAFDYIPETVFSPALMAAVA